jgi:hypothetical protein
MKRATHARRGGILVETALLLPVVMALLIGTVELGRVIYTYYMMQKIMFTLARYLGTQQGVNFCDPGDPNVQAALNYAISGDTSTSQNPLVAGLVPAMFQIGIERLDPITQQIIPCDCSSTGCDASVGGLPPDFIVVTLVNFNVQPVFWGFTVTPFPLSPSVRVPYGGT